jgi:hypothetical protein
MIRLYQVKLYWLQPERHHISLNMIRHIHDRDLRTIMNDKMSPVL